MKTSAAAHGGEATTADVEDLLLREYLRETQRILRPAQIARRRNQARLAMARALHGEAPSVTESALDLPA